MQDKDALDGRRATIHNDKNTTFLFVYFINEKDYFNEAVPNAYYPSVQHTSVSSLVFKWIHVKIVER